MDSLGVTEDYLDPQSEEKGISTSAREFIGNLVYKLIREISEPTLYLYDNDHYEGFLFQLRLASREIVRKEVLNLKGCGSNDKIEENGYCADCNNNQVRIVVNEVIQAAYPYAYYLSMIEEAEENKPFGTKYKQLDFATYFNNY
ncbi:2137_t:CDS:2 [Gigaspora margarita]|uniref:2137_t:CDS:1 n=1 Tax=Gigaspora margarita TaxID=4874 RepID=A0ABN7WDF6_GIGMA|nr:2137_t:CDS:2 [Gigaspora margarita]